MDNVKAIARNAHVEHAINVNICEDFTIKLSQNYAAMRYLAVEPDDEICSRVLNFCLKTSSCKAEVQGLPEQS